MTTSKPDNTPKSDDEWKVRVREEAAAIDAEPQAGDSKPESASTGNDSGGAESSESPEPQIDPSQLPPASMTTLVSMFSTQAMVALGMLGDPSSGQQQFQPALAKHFIDLLGVVEEKTKGNLSEDEAKLLDSSLHELRMAFVHLSNAKSS